MAKMRLIHWDLAERTGLAVSAIRYYEGKGLVSHGRNAGGQRRFERADIRRLSFVMIAQQFGFSLPEISRRAGSIANGRTPTPADWAASASNFVRHWMHESRHCRNCAINLDGCIGCGCL